MVEGKAEKGDCQENRLPFSGFGLLSQKMKEGERKISCPGEWRLSLFSFQSNKTQLS